jgi:Protein of unknown function (DUF2852)
MSSTQGAFNGGGDNYVYGRRIGRGGGRWSAFEIAAMVLGFIVFWPIGLAILGYKLWQSKMGGPDMQTVAQRGWSQARSAWTGATPGPQSWGFGSSGNSAFDAWKQAELARLEEERRRLEESHREFAEFMENVRRAKDREEFERFMQERRNRQGA